MNVWIIIAIVLVSMLVGAVGMVYLLEWAFSNVPWRK